MVKAMAASQVHDTETEKSQNHHSHATNGERSDYDNMAIDVFRWSHCKNPLPQRVMRSVGIPLPLEYLEVIFTPFVHFGLPAIFFRNLLECLISDNNLPFHKPL